MAARSRPKSTFRTVRDNGINLGAFQESSKLYASITDALDSQRLRIFDSQEGSLKTEYALEGNQRVSSICWDQAVEYDVEPIDGSIGGSGHVVLLGTEQGEIIVYSEALGTVTKTYGFGQLGKITKVALLSSFAFAIDSFGKLVQFNVNNGSAIQIMKITTPSREFSGVYPSPCIPNFAIVTSHSAHLLALPDSNPVDTLTTHTTLVQSVVYSSASTPSQNFVLFATAAEQDRFVNLFSKQVSDKKLTDAPSKNIGALVCENDVQGLASCEKIEEATGKKGSILAALSVDGTIEIFDNPWESKLSSGSGGLASLSRKRKQLTSHSNLRIRFSRSRGGVPITLESISFVNADTIVVAWKEATRTIFESVPWKILSSQATDGLLEVVRPKSRDVNKVGKPVVTYDEANATVTSGVMQKHAAGIPDIPTEEEAQAEEQEPSLAERLQTLAKLDQQAQATPTQVSASSSLATVLAQALRTNDQALLESCFNNQSLEVIENTVRRLDSTLAPALLDKVADRLARRPLRADTFLTWIRCTLIFHGGHLSLIRDLKDQLATLRSVLETRASKYTSMLALQGRLDMVFSQIALRKAGGSKDNAENEEPITVYYDGFEEYEDMEEDEDEDEEDMDSEEDDISEDLSEDEDHVTNDQAPSDEDYDQELHEEDVQHDSSDEEN
ncbi:U3 snoRNP-associated protein Utp5 [Schizosaccharomyces cryophilus OY26]|uniref:U3 snoRNP-associated protein Utp5 n=1 Tax=Schizosaccharomyces cryophilus (strain OY26 / ATCC MYA-4695 / CBS 11777 / NBRC 106824 / NRRL Y48691) TaxID=653667 RepID=S9VVA2_SCHCR|nr:U3 snoRNP-associated protein Utp5 [Schizosaccharomyces cryophilus OY26]EPY51713.1 U3 snoRNP-associated protein Utp5 [Schizosaccharomyces cryophilus OY26]